VDSRFFRDAIDQQFAGEVKEVNGRAFEKGFGAVGLPGI
jgi:hypothetical protein